MLNLLLHGQIKYCMRERFSADDVNYNTWPLAEAKSKQKKKTGYRQKIIAVLKLSFFKGYRVETTLQKNIYFCLRVKRELFYFGNFEPTNPLKSHYLKYHPYQHLQLFCSTLISISLT